MGPISRASSSPSSARSSVLALWSRTSSDGSDGPESRMVQITSLSFRSSPRRAVAATRAGTGPSRPRATRSTSFAARPWRASSRSRARRSWSPASKSSDTRPPAIVPSVSPSILRAARLLLRMSPSVSEMRIPVVSASTALEESPEDRRRRGSLDEEESGGTGAGAAEEIENGLVSAPSPDTRFVRRCRRRVSASPVSEAEVLKALSRTASRSSYGSPGSAMLFSRTNRAAAATGVAPSRRTPRCSRGRSPATLRATTSSNSLPRSRSRRARVP